MNVSEFELLRMPFRRNGVGTTHDLEWNVDQYPLYAMFISPLREFAETLPEASPLLAAIAEVEVPIRDFIQMHRDKANLIRMTMPRLLEADVIEFQERYKALAGGFSNAENWQLAIKALAALSAETRMLQLAFLKPQTNVAAVMSAEIASYMSWLTWEETRNDSKHAVERAISEFNSRFPQMMNEGNSRIAEMSSSVIEIQKANAAAIAELRQFEKNADIERANVRDQVLDVEKRALRAENNASQASSLTENTQKNIELFKSSVMEALKIDTSKKLWDAAARQSSWAFWLSALMLGTFLVVLPVVALFNLDTVIAALRHIGEATTQDLPKDGSATATQLTVVAISRLVVVTIPLALYFWIIRLLVRFNLRSLMLVDDARQRRTMMDTYFHLIEQDASTKADRALILNALFRPTPGHSAESVDAPNFTELLDKAMGK